VPLAQPEIRAGGHRYVGEPLVSLAPGTWLYRFPPTSFGSGLDFNAGPFVRTNSPGSGFVAIDLTVAMARSLALPSGSNEVALSQADIVASSGPLQATALQMERGTARGDSRKSFTVFVIGLGSAAGPFVHAHFGSDGLEATSGPIAAGPPAAQVAYPSLDDAHSLLYLWIDGRDNSVVYGTWELRLQP
jgi:hypothetical protein